MNLRRTALASVTAVALFGLAACDGGGQPEEAEDNEAQAPAESTAPAEEPAQETGESAAGTTPDVEEETPSPSASKESTEGSANGQDTGSSEATQTAAADNGQAAAQALGCTACHAAETKLVGPPYQAVAERYGGDKARILEVMKTSVKNGAQGNWTDVTGGVAMPAQPQAVGQDDKLEAVAEWVAGMAE
jgi:cytochrome c